MNSLSWLLYAANVAGNIAFVAGSAAIVLIVGAGGVALFGTMVADVMTPYGQKTDFSKFFATARTMLISGFCIAVALAFIPGKNTIMLIAASEVGESVLASDQVQEIGGEAGALAKDSLRVLRKFINEQLGEAE